MEYPEYNDEMWPLLSDVKRPSRYAGCEFGARPPKEGKNGLVRFCLAFPDVYEIGMSFLGFQILYQTAADNAFAKVWYERHTPQMCRLVPKKPVLGKERGPFSSVKPVPSLLDHSL